MVVPASLVALPLPEGDVRVKDRDAGAPLGPLELHLEPRVRAAGGELRRAPDLDDAPALEELDRTTLYVAVPGRELAPDGRVDLGWATGEGSVGTAVQPGRVHALGQGGDQGRQAESIGRHRDPRSVKLAPGTPALSSFPRRPSSLLARPRAASGPGPYMPDITLIYPAAATAMPGLWVLRANQASTLG